MLGSRDTKDPVPPLPLPAELDDFLRRPNPAVVASLRPDGWPHTAATWYLWDGERVLLNMDESRLRLRFMRRDPRVALTALDEGGWYRHVSLLGHVVEIVEDERLEDIDRLSLHYSGEPFRNRESRRFSAWVEPDSWHAWEGAAPWPVPASP
jgi:PPOX class probable F420-dependent enzyme